MAESAKEANRELLIRMREGDESALDRLVELNMGLVRKIAAHFTSTTAEQEDLIQIGVIGMIKAARSFDFSFDTVFSTYAVPMITGEIRRFLRDDGAIKVGREIKSRGARIMACREAFRQTHCREPRLSEIASELSLSEQEVVDAMEATSAVCSLCEPIGGDEEGLTLEGTIPAKEDLFDDITDRLALSEAIRALPPLWREIIVLRYFKELSQSETGKRLGLTQVKISREEQKILSALRAALTG
ncbi:MAG: sigma-70 family RNA polymerase sigma factor [Clostridia bacterium]|nr:sigma-70 family RNA polymerase sigma factor [Clostridia bacterium]